MTLNPYVWLPHFEFTLQTIAVQYPKKPNEVTKKKYYEFISNIPVFFPIKPLGKSFSNMLNKYPVTPYLDSRTAFMKWTHFHRTDLPTTHIPQISSRSISDVQKVKK